MASQFFAAIRGMISHFVTVGDALDHEYDWRIWLAEAEIRVKELHDIYFEVTIDDEILNFRQEVSQTLKSFVREIECITVEENYSGLMIPDLQFFWERLTVSRYTQLIKMLSEHYRVFASLSAFQIEIESIPYISEEDIVYRSSLFIYQIYNPNQVVKPF